MSKEKLLIVEKNKIIKVFTSPRDLVVKVAAQGAPAVVKAIPMVGARGAIGPTGPLGPTGPIGLKSVELGADGNNELEITGIENRTVVDSVRSEDWRWLKYMVSISKTFGGANKFYATEISVLVDQQNLNVSEYAVLDNDGDMGTIEVSKNGNLVELVVIPNPAIAPITVRFARIGLKS